MSRPAWTVLAGLIVAAACAPSGHAFGDDQAIDYARQIKPLLRERCYACHGALKQEAGLRLDTAELLRKGSDEGPIIMAGPPASGRLLERVRSTDLALRMPPEGHPLSAEQIDLVRRWIEQGAAGPANETPERDPREHWSFRAPMRPPLPSLDVAALAATRNPVDRFVLRQLVDQGLAPRRDAAPETQLRRVYLDLIGVPPTPDEVREFLADPSDEAYAATVDRLLDSPLYGERWGRHWMDVWRYSDWYGRRHVPDVWNSAPQIWRWRDWIVDSLNADAGYDQMVRAMLAADELYPGDDRQGVATGYLIRNWFALNPNYWMRENVEHTAKAFLGLTFNCAHCHDHKYDPISQVDYFRFRAFFEPIGIRQDRVANESEPGKFQEYEYSVLRKIQRLGMVSVYDKTAEAPTWFYTGGDERNRVKERGSIVPGVPAVFSDVPFEVAALELPPAAWNPGVRPAIQATELRERDAAVAKAEQERSAAHAECDAPLAQRKQELAAAEGAYREAVAAVKNSGQSGALAGQQSLLLDATTGRRILTQSLSEVRSLPAGSTLRFQLRIMRDAHFNFQLVKDNAKGLTAGMIAFEKGRILSYQPGGFTEFEIGKYDLAAGQAWFDIEWVIEPMADRCRLTVRDHRDGKALADQAAVALNGWSPVGDPNKPVSFDARTGAVVAIDELTVELPPQAAEGTGAPTGATQRVAYFDFESPKFEEGKDAVGLQGWAASNFGMAPATSVVSNLLENTESLAAPRKKWLDARQAASALELKVLAAEQAATAAKLLRDAVAARVEADRRRYTSPADPGAANSIQAAIQAERAAAVAQAEANWTARRRDLVAAESLAATDMKRDKEIVTATAKLTESRVALDKLLAQPLPSDYSPLGGTYPRQSTGRRSGLAKWIADRRNPLAARVAVNHIWLRHFGSPLVATVFDFGRNGAAPTHPELLDWLAVEFQESGWSMKYLHRLLVTSSVYRQSSGSQSPAAFELPLAPGAAAPQAAAIDPQNRLLWRMNARRMEAEAVRDSLLFVADQLDLRPRGQELENSEALKTRRRSLYYSCHPEQGGKNDLAMLFDGADAAECYRRATSVTPQQALALTNSQLVHELSGALAARLAEPSADSPEQFVERAFARILSRAPTPEERRLCIEFLARSGGEAAANVAASRESLVRALLNHHDFVTIR